MIARFSRFLDRVSTGWPALAAIVLFALTIAFVLPAQAERAEEYSNGAASPDSSFFYSANNIYASAEAFGAAGRADYVQARYTFDVVWPLVYAVALSVLLSWLLKRAVPAASRWRRLNLLPWLALVLDAGENISAAIVVGRYPDRTPVLADIATFFTMGKWIVLSAAFIALAVVAVLAIVRRRAPSVQSDAVAG